MTWTPARLDLLTKLVREGVPYREIAAQLGSDVTRNAAIGKARRLGLGGHLSPEAKAARMRGAKERAGKIRQIQLKSARGTADRNGSRVVCLRPAPRAAVPALPALNLPLESLTEHTCKYPVTEAPTHLFCGQPSLESYPWCEFHKHVCTRRGTQRDFDRMATAGMGGKMYLERAAVMA